MTTSVLDQPLTIDLRIERLNQTILALSLPSVAESLGPAAMSPNARRLTFCSRGTMPGRRTCSATPTLLARLA